MKDKRTYIEPVNRCKTRGGILTGNKYVVEKYLGLILAGCFVYYIVCFLTRGEFVQSMFVSDASNTFMDYFSSINNAKFDPYVDMNSNYPALACLIYKFLFHIVPVEHYGGDGFNLRNVQTSMVGFMLYTMICLYFTAFIIREKLELKNRSASLAILVVFISAPFMFTLERGNLILVAFILTMFFCLFYESENKYIREIAYLCLAIAAAIKLYPAIFGLLIIKKRKWKAAVRTTAYGILMFVVPFFYYDGFKSLKIMVNALLYTSNLTEKLGEEFGYGVNVSLYNICQCFSSILGIGLSGITIAVINIIVVGILVLAVIRLKKEWKVQLALAMLLILLPKTNYYYALLFLIIPFVGALNDWNKSEVIKEEKVLNCGYAMAFAGILIPWATTRVEALSQNVKFFVTFGMLFQYIVVAWLGILLTIECIGNKTKLQRVLKKFLLSAAGLTTFVIGIKAIFVF